MMIVLAPIICNLSLSMGFNAMPILMMLAFAANLENDLNIVTVNIAAGHIDKILCSGRERAGEV